MKRQRIAPDLKEQIINRIKNDGVTVSQAAADHGIARTPFTPGLPRKSMAVQPFQRISNLKEKMINLKSFWVKLHSSCLKPKKRNDFA